MTEKQINIEDLVQDDHNFNRGTEQGAKLIEKSFQDHGAGRSVLLDKDNRLIAGNKATKGAIAAGIKKVRIIETTGDELIAVKRTDVSLDSKEGREMAMLDNLTTQVNMSWDKVELETVAEQVQGFDVSQFGFDIDSLPQAQAPEGGSGESQPKKQVNEDEFDENEDEIHVRCKKGDVWELGEHRLMCGDCIDLQQVKTLMGGVNCDLWLTDPPYNVGYGMEGPVMMSKRKHRTDGLIVPNDKQEDSDFLQFLISAYTAALNHMKPGASFYIFHSDVEGFNFRKAIREVKGMKLSECLIWVKNTLCLGRNDYQWKHEPCLYGWKEGADHKWYSDHKQTTTLEFERPSKSAEHPTMKPVALFGYLIQNSTKANDIVLDTFGGSGTTVIACEQLDRKAMIMEIDPHYCDVIISRWEKFTGKTAIKVQPQN